LGGFSCIRATCDWQITVAIERYRNLSGGTDHLRNGEWLLKNSFMLEPAEIKSRWDAL